MIEIKKDFSPRELLLFGPLFALFVGLIGGLLIWKLGLHDVAYWMWGLSVPLIAVYYAVPGWRRSIYRGWLWSVFPIGWVVSHVIFALIFYLVFTPVGLLMRLFGYDPLRRRACPEASTYWIEKSPVSDPKSYFRQF
jgi:hypothetical protein